MEVNMSLSRSFSVAVFLLISAFSGHCQFFDDFSDDSSGLVCWNGDTAHFRYTSSTAIPVEQRPALQLNTTGSGKSVIYALQPWNSMMEWSAWFKLSFNPSASNHVRFYLTGSTSFPAITEDAVFIGVGMDNDLVGLYYESAGQTVPLIIDTVNIYNQSTNQLRFKVVCKSNHWFLYTNPTGGNTLTLVDSIFYPVTPDIALAGVECRYTSSNATKFYVDDVLCGGLTIDTLSPFLREFSLKDPFQISLKFSEPIHSSNSQNLAGFTVSNPVGKPLLCVITDSDPSTVHLHYPFAFPDGQQLTLTLCGITDRAGNVMVDSVISFTWYTALRNDVLITEIMADPSPAVKLPESEYIEINNVASFDISLCGWTLWIDNTRIPLPCMVLPGDGYLLLVNENDTSLWEGYTYMAGLSKLQLKNEGACLALQDFKGNLVHAVCYLSAWHATTHQADGGYSLELKDSENPCDQTGTWCSSRDVTGGTPGKQNSFFNPFSDIKAPATLKVSVINDMLLQVSFSEPLDTMRNMLILFEVENIPGAISSFSLKTPLYNQVDFHLAEHLLPDKIYHLVQKDTLKDCAGNFSLGAKLPFGIPAIPDSADLVFNEIMFIPSVYGEEYIELYNNSNRIIDLSMCVLARIDTLEMVVEDIYPLTDQVALLFPDDYAVITRNVDKVLANHPNAKPGKVHLSSKLPSLPDQGGDYIISGQNGRWLDRMTFLPAFHAPGISDTRGIALERLSVSMSGSRRENWYSASAASGWATPTRSNSQGPSSSLIAGKPRVEPSWFSPHSTLKNNLAFVFLDEIPVGTRAGIIVVDESGRTVRHLLRESIAASGDCIPWDGTCNNGALCPGGVYIVCVYLYQEQMGYRKYKIPVVLID